MGLHLEPDWNSWNMFLNEYGKDLLEYRANFTYVKFQDHPEKILYMISYQQLAEMFTMKYE